MRLGIHELFQILWRWVYDFKVALLDEKVRVEFPSLGVFPFLPCEFDRVVSLGCALEPGVQRDGVRPLAQLADELPLEYLPPAM